MERRKQPRLEISGAAGINLIVEVQLPGGIKAPARVLNFLPSGGACLVFDEDPQLDVGNVISVSYDRFLASGEVRHVGEVGGAHRVGVSWEDD